MGENGLRATGLYDGFEGFRSPSPQDLELAVRDWLVVLDTNVLLNLYKYQGPSLDDFLKVFAALGDRLFLPHQVVDEFWRNRRSVLLENRGRLREVERVQEAFDSAQKAFRSWYMRVVDRVNPPPEVAFRYLEDAKSRLLEYMNVKNAEAAPVLPDTPTYGDRVLRQLEPLLRGRVGPSPSTTESQELRRRGLQRVKERVPPGYMDGEKDPDRAVGDYLVWEQTMAEAKGRDIDVLFVTQDQKEDWWADRGTDSQRARPELVAELRAHSGRAFLMIRAQDLLGLASYLGVSVSEATVAEAESTTDIVDGWTVEAATAYLQLLKAQWPEHYQILREAVRSGGEISRERMAEHLHRSANDSMRGQGRPYATATRRLVERGILDEEAAPTPLTAAFEGGGVMVSFVMPENLVSLFNDAITTGTDAEAEE